MLLFLHSATEASDVRDVYEANPEMIGVDFLEIRYLFGVTDDVPQYGAREIKTASRGLQDTDNQTPTQANNQTYISRIRRTWNGQFM